jgi:AcrR family transcriptional regulator
MSIRRTRLSQEDSRQAALAAARDLLIEAGPQAVTLKAVAARIGRTHANLLHHFGSALGLQKALAASLAEVITAKIAAAVQRSRSGEGHPTDVVDLTFDAFDTGGAGALASWMLLSGNVDALDPIVEAIHRLVDDLDEDAHADTELHEITLSLVLTALGDALLGRSLAAALGLPRDTARQLALKQLLGSTRIAARLPAKPSIPD